ncbi:MAG: hypothetical protein JWO41_145 [Candidatus Saccharibacteria bacterium]|nr:hypothetical protein [Candidatus Saccharibacteria bacterium]
MNPADANNQTPAPEQAVPTPNAVSPAGGFPIPTQNQTIAPQFVPQAQPQVVAPIPLPPPPAQPVVAQPAPVYAAPPQQPQPQPQAQVRTSPVPGPQQQPVAPRAKPNSTQNTLQIAEIRDGIVIMSDGSYRSVIMAKSINFDLMSSQEQEAVEYSYQGFLNSLYFPVQIFVRSSKVDLGPYIDKLDKIRTEHDNMLLALLMDDYITYIDNLSSQTNIMDKRFYLVIPYFPVADVQKALTQSKNFFSGITALINPKEAHVVINEADLESAKTELRNRVQSVMSGLLQCGIQGLPLDTQELIELYYDAYNPDTATRQQLKNFDELSADIITKGQGVASQAHLQRELQ